MTENIMTYKTGATGSVASTALFCQCATWCRAEMSPYPGRSKDGLPLLTNHHPNCDRYNDSLIDVWMVSYEGEHYYSNIEILPEEMEEGETVRKETMHREVYEQLPEFAGF